MLQAWIVGAVVCFLLCFYLVIDCRKYGAHDYPIWYDVFFGRCSDVLALLGSGCVLTNDT